MLLFSITAMAPFVVQTQFSLLMNVIPEVIRRKIATGGAMHHLSEHYPERYKGKIPLKVKMLDTVSSDLPVFLMQEDEQFPLAIKENEYYVSVNCHGAVTAIFDDGRVLGLKPDEFEVIEFHDQGTEPSTERRNDAQSE